MRVVQIYNALLYGDGATQCIINLAQVLDNAQIENIIYACSIDSRCEVENVRMFVDLADIEFRPDDVIIYHFANGCALNNDVEHLKRKKILVFQNVTDPDFYRYVDEPTFKTCLQGKYEAAHTVGKYLKAITMSEFSKKELVSYGWQPEDIYVIPLIKKADNQSSANIEDKKDCNILYVGRIAPNKKIEDLLRVFDYYSRHYNPQSRLVLIGENRYPVYWNYLSKLLDEMKNENVVWKGHISDEERDREYRRASIYLCMSEHEGFCMPIMEAMGYDIPVVAYAATAVPDTMGEAGILFDNKAPQYVSRIIEEINEGKRNEIIIGQRRRLEEFCIERYADAILELIQSVDGLDNYEYVADNDFFYVERKTNYPLLSKEDEIVIYGCGMNGKKLIAALQKSGYRIGAICDNCFYEKQYDGIPIRGVEECVLKYPNSQYVITSIKNVVEMTASLIVGGINEKQVRVYMGYNDTII